jgi:hypothetical protein
VHGVVAALDGVTTEPSFADLLATEPSAVDEHVSSVYTGQGVQNRLGGIFTYNC